MTDNQYTDSIIDTVRVRNDGYELTSNGWTMFCQKVEGLPEPVVGETLRLYGRGIGFPVRGIAVNGRVYRYITEAEQQTQHEQWCRDRDAEREQELHDNLAKTDSRILALPVVFRERIRKFQRDGGHEFRRDYESYELFCCEQAVIIADTLHTAKAIIAFHELDWAAQKQLVPSLEEGHSGNTFGVACALARMYVERPEFVTKLHGALTPLVGCEAYGCRHDEEQGR